MQQTYLSSCGTCWSGQPGLHRVINQPMKVTATVIMSSSYSSNALFFFLYACNNPPPKPHTGTDAWLTSPIPNSPGCPFIPFSWRSIDDDTRHILLNRHTNTCMHDWMTGSYPFDDYRLTKWKGIEVTKRSRVFKHHMGDSLTVAGSGSPEVWMIGSAVGSANKLRAVLRATSCASQILG